MDPLDALDSLRNDLDALMQTAQRGDRVSSLQFTSAMRAFAHITNAPFAPPFIVGETMDPVLVYAWCLTANAIMALAAGAASKDGG